MKVTHAVFGTACAVGFALTGLTASAQQYADKTPVLPPTINDATPRLAVRPAPTPSLAPLPTKADPTEDMGKLEVVTARYPNGKVKIEREVGQDSAGNYFNQGSFKMYSINGDLVKSGEFLNGKQIGKWTQKLAKDEGHLFSSIEDGDLAEPFVSEATFQDGRLHGIWTIKDSRAQTLISWSFDNGVPAGAWTWWYANGQKRLEATYTNGALNGEVTEWARDGKIINKNSYIDGKCVVKSVQWYMLGQKHFEGNYLHATGMPKANYDWWNSKIAVSAATGDVPDQQNGTWTEWYPGGNKKTEGEYDHGVAVGRFTWWFENGQKQAEGEYENGLKTGAWITWHANGLKESMGEYKSDKLVSKLLTWSEDGKLVDAQQNGQAQTAMQPQQPTVPRTGQHGFRYNR